MRLDPRTPSVPTTRPISPTATARSPLITAMGGLSLSDNRPPQNRGEQPPTPVWHTRPTASSKYFLPAGTPSHLRPEAMMLPIEEEVTRQQPVLRLAPSPQQDLAAVPTLHDGETEDGRIDRTTTPSPVDWPPPGPGITFRLPPSPGGRDFADKCVMAEMTRDIGVQAGPRVSFRTVATVKEPAAAGGYTISHTPITGSPAVGVGAVLPLSPPVTSSDIALAVSTPSAASPRLTASVKHEPGIASAGGEYVPRIQQADNSHRAGPESCLTGPLSGSGSRAVPVVSPTPVAAPARPAPHARVASACIESPGRAVSPARADSPARAVPAARVASPTSGVCPNHVTAPFPATRPPLARVLSPDSFVEAPRRVNSRNAIGVPSSDDEAQYWSSVVDPFARSDEDEEEDGNPAPRGETPAPSAPSSPVPTAKSRGYHYSFFGGEEVIVAPDPPQRLRGKSRYIVVTAGWRVGVFRDWTHASPYVVGCPGARHEGFKKYSEAIERYQLEKALRNVEVILR
ncbi:hypothetical protein VTO73DRAFT_12788 [Trametes versicolor]